MSKLLIVYSSVLMLSTTIVFGSTAQNLSYLSTEKSHPATTSVSQIMHKDCVQGLNLLHQVDMQVVPKLYEFINNYFAHLTQLVDRTRANNGRCFVVGAGSSGRVAIDLAARCSKDVAVIGVMAGGDSTFIRAREGFEDSESSGLSALQEYAITSHDLVILISASGSASFNVGCAQYARNAGATVCYIYNSMQVPAKTQLLFDQLGVIPILVDLGPQAITGSTRLQAATFARLALGCVFTDCQPCTIIEGFTAANGIIGQNLDAIAHIIKIAHGIFADPQSNFRKIKDETLQGYVTYVGDATVLREIIMDTVETAPTFSTNPPRMSDELDKKRAEFQAYLAGAYDNTHAWQTLIGRPLNPNDLERSLQFLITDAGLRMRPMGRGNLLIGVAWQDPQPLMAHFARARKQRAKTALILLADCEIAQRTYPECDAVVIVDNIPHDATGLIAAVTLKQVLNMISNGTMILMNKVDGNRMIDVNASNNKLIDRAIRLTHSVLGHHYGDINYDYATIESCMHEILMRKKEYEEKNRYTPSPVKLAITMLCRGVNFDDAVILLRECQENLEGVCL